MSARYALNSWMLIGLMLTSSCSVNSIDPFLTVAMQGSQIAVEGASGSQSPQYQTYTLTAITASVDDSSVNLWRSEDNPNENVFKIIERKQKLAAIAIKDYANKTFSSISFQFEPNIQGAIKQGTPIDTVLSQSTITYNVPLTLAEGRSYDLLLTANWGNTISNGTMEQPSITVTLD